MDEPNKPIWKARIFVSETKNLNITMWAPRPGDDIQSPSIVFEESKKDEEGNWANNPVKYLPAGKLLEIAAQMKEAWLEYKRQTKRN